MCMPKDNCTKYHLSASFTEKDHNQTSETDIVCILVCIQMTVTITVLFLIHPLIPNALSIPLSPAFSLIVN